MYARKPYERLSAPRVADYYWNRDGSVDICDFKFVQLQGEPEVVAERIYRGRWPIQKREGCCNSLKLHWTRLQFATLVVAPPTVGCAEKPRAQAFGQHEDKLADMP